MAQKINPIAFRAGHNRKWNEGWYALGFEWKKIFFYQRNLEQFFQFLFQSKLYTKISRRKKILLFDIKLFKYLYSKFFVFVLFYRMRTHRRKEIRPICKTLSIKEIQKRKFKKFKFRFYQNNVLKKFKNKRFKKSKQIYWAFNFTTLKKYSFFPYLSKLKYFKYKYQYHILNKKLKYNIDQKIKLQTGFFEIKKLKKVKKIKWKKNLLLSILRI